MTLRAEHPPSSSPPEGMPALVLRVDKRPRLPLWYWIFHPRRARWITDLIRESFRWRNSPNAQTNAVTWGEHALLERAAQVRQKAVTDSAQRIRRLAGQYQSLRLKANLERRLAELERARQFTPEIGGYLYAAGPVGVAGAKEIISRCQERIEADTERGQTRHLERPSKARDAASSAPLLIDIAALTAVIAKFFNVTPGNAISKAPETVTVIGFALISALVLALLAHSIGNSVWHRRSAVARSQRSDAGEDSLMEFPPVRPVLYGKLIALFAVSLTASVSISMRVMHPTADVSTGPLGVAVGLMVGLATFIAPWIVVISKMRSGSLEVRTIDALTTTLRQIEDAASQHERNAVDTDNRANRIRSSAEQARTAKFESAMDFTAIAKEVIDLARSYHRQAGRYAVDLNLPAEDPYVAIRDVLKTDDTPIDTAMRLFDDIDEDEAGSADA